MRIYGFTLLRNGIKYDYPYLESLRSLTGLCERVTLALGRSDDGTEATLREFRNIDLVPTVWDESLRKSGLILSQQTNVALESLRAKLRVSSEGLQGAWGIYLQADEVLCEQEFDRIREDIKQAEEQGCDAVRFRYLHFWQRYDRIAIGRRWYPEEIRAIRLDSSIESYGDAQGFKGYSKVYESDSHVFHYGHVRDQQAYELKKNDFHRWWHADSELSKVIARGLRKDKREETLRYLGPHPQVMRERMGRPKAGTMGGRLHLIGSPERYPESFVRSIQAAEVVWHGRLREVPRAERAQVVVLEPRAWMKWFKMTRVPTGMRAPHARPWTPEFQALLRLSEKGVAAERIE